MPTKKDGPSYLKGRSIGRGGAGIDFATSQSRADEIIQEAELIELSAIPRTPLDLIDPNPFQRRRRMSEKALAELEADFKRNGITTVIIGRRNPADHRRVQIAYGHRRVKVTQRCHDQDLEGFDGYPIIIKEISDLEMRLLMIGENQWREDPSPLDYADQYASYIEATGCTQEQAAEFFNVSRGTLRERLALLDDDQDLQALVDDIPDAVRAVRDLRKVADAEIRAQVIADLRAGNITGTQVPLHIETLSEAKQARLEQVKSALPALNAGASGTEHRESNGATPSSSSPLPVSTPSSALYTPAFAPSTVEGEGGRGDGDGKEGRRSDAASSVVSAPQGAGTSFAAGQADLPVVKTQLEEAQLLERSRLKTLRKGMEGYGERLAKRLSVGETLPAEEAALIRQIRQLATDLLEKSGA